MKIAISYQGRFCLSHFGIMEYLSMLEGPYNISYFFKDGEIIYYKNDDKGNHDDYNTTNLRYNIPRDDELLIATIENIGEFANGEESHLKIVEIPDDVKWEIFYNDDTQSEIITEKHRSWC